MEITVVGLKEKPNITLSELKDIAKNTFGNLVKAVVDVENKIMAVAGEMHADEEEFLLKRGSQQKNLWGINLYPELKGDEFIEFDSVINLRPFQGNFSRNVDDPKIREKIKAIVKSLVVL
jgi:hypothetical protein